MKETLKQKIARVTREKVDIVPYSPEWPALFQSEKKHLLDCLPPRLIRRIEHFGSTAVPGLSAKPVIDILVEVASLEDTKSMIAPVLESQGYDYFWRPSFGDDIPPYYAWFIKRGAHGERLCHIHMVEKDFEHWNRLYFRDYLIEFPDFARQYEEIKINLASQFPNDRVAYTRAKTDFITKITGIAKIYYEKRVKPRKYT